MARTKGSLNKQSANHPDFLELNVEERLAFIVNLMIEQLYEEQRTNSHLWQPSEQSHVASLTA